jgi:hypothetical protein
MNKPTVSTELVRIWDAVKAGRLSFRTACLQIDKAVAPLVKKTTSDQLTRLRSAAVNISRHHEMVRTGRMSGEFDKVDLQREAVFAETTELEALL